ncbi:hypothetical protein [Psychrobacter sp. I-STPA10]|uniref:hypothetical protein n=1 Tax=Psychrobacter sp. I-STPA10 TaxID=2585769 RepID=UPI001E2F384F|nr:hypothetical protein [Psychrobacter sp. I-STPA10]
MIMTTSLAQISPLMTWSSFGYLLLTIGIIAMLLSPYRYLIAYLLAGMVYWFIIDAIQSVLLYLFAVDHWQSYIYSLAITWIFLGIWFIYRLHKRSHISNSNAQSTLIKNKYGETYIEHTPVYTNYQPRFPNPNSFNQKQLHK